jgi:purine/pyrimidine-nucleoside phosphorylase
MSQFPEKFDNVSAVCKANVFFDGKVVSHSVLLADGSRKTLGLIYPGTYHFDTKAAEVMAITVGTCRVKLAGQSAWTGYAEGTSFNVPANSGFDIAADAIVQYICSFQ